MARQYLSIDVGGTAVKSARIDHSGNIIAKKRTATPRNRAAFLHLLTTIVDQQPGVVAICLSVPGIVNPTTGVVKFTGALAFMGQVSLADYLCQYAGLPVYVGNDANCATLAELWLGNLTGRGQWSSDHPGDLGWRRSGHQRPVGSWTSLSSW